MISINLELIKDVSFNSCFKEYLENNVAEFKISAFRDSHFEINTA